MLVDSKSLDCKLACQLGVQNQAGLTLVGKQTKITFLSQTPPALWLVADHVQKAPAQTQEWTAHVESRFPYNNNLALSANKLLVVISANDILFSRSHVQVQSFQEKEA